MGEVLDENEIYCCLTCLVLHDNLERIGMLSAGGEPEKCEFCGREYWQLCVCVEKESAECLTN